jgi:hypothetical protein
VASINEYARAANRQTVRDPEQVIEQSSNNGADDDEDEDDEDSNSDDNDNDGDIGQTPDEYNNGDDGDEDEDEEGVIEPNG